MEASRGIPSTDALVGRGVEFGGGGGVAGFVGVAVGSRGLGGRGKERGGEPDLFSRQGRAHQQSKDGEAENGQQVEKPAELVCLLVHANFVRKNQGLVTTISTENHSPNG